MMSSYLKVIWFISLHRPIKLLIQNGSSPEMWPGTGGMHNNIYGVDFRAGINNDTYKYYIDFASKNKIEYIILDEGWYDSGNILESIPEINVPELCNYAESKNVGVILWVVWKTFWDKIDEATALYEKWGVKGVKVDFMQRDDQKVVNFYLEASKKDSRASSAH